MPAAITEVVSTIARGLNGSALQPIRQAEAAKRRMETEAAPGQQVQPCGAADGGR
jgi:hypothetical protein